MKDRKPTQRDGARVSIIVSPTLAVPLPVSAFPPHEPFRLDTVAGNAPRVRSSLAFDVPARNLGVAILARNSVSAVLGDTHTPSGPDVGVADLREAHKSDCS